MDYLVSPHTGREYLIDENGIAHRAYEDEAAWEANDDLMRAEFYMSWVCGGGRAEDAGAAYRQHLHGGVPGLPEDDGTCEHGLSLSLCAGPNHYPMDD